MALISKEREIQFELFRKLLLARHVEDRSTQNNRAQFLELRVLIPQASLVQPGCRLSDTDFNDPATILHLPAGVPDRLDRKG